VTHSRTSILLAPAIGGLVAATLLAQGAPPSQGLTFDVVSLKRNTEGFQAPAYQPGPSGEYRMPNAPVRGMFLRGWPVATLPVTVRNLPSWAETERYDVIARGKLNATPDEQQQMWRALLTERLKLVAHHETEEQAAYRLVIARPERGHIERPTGN
jgi:uncharacterized protein (TIGR03435 family)